MGLTRIRAEQISDIDYKQAVRVISVTNVTLSGGAPATVDGVSLQVGDRVLVAGQSAAAQNGLYRVQTVGTGSNGTWVRTSDANEDGEIQPGMVVMVTQGTEYADTPWKLVTNGDIEIGVTELTFEENYSLAFGNIVANGTAVVANTVSAPITFTAGDNIAITGNNTTKTVTFAVTGITTSRIANGTSNVDIATADGNVTTAVAGNTILTVASTGANVAGLITATGNVTGGNIATAGELKSTGTFVIGTQQFYAQGSDGFSVNENFNAGNATVTAYHYTSGAGRNGIVFDTAVTGQFTNGFGATGNAAQNKFVSFAEFGNTTWEWRKSVGISAPNLNGGTLLANINPDGNLYTLGTITTTGNITGGNLTTTGTANIGTLAVTGTSTFTGNLLPSANITYDLGSDSQRWRDLYLANSTIYLGNAQISANATAIIITNPAGGETVMSGASPALIADTVTATGNVTGGNLVTAGVLSVTGNANVGNLGAATVTATTLTGTLSTASQTNITSVGTLSALTVTGNVSGGNLTTAGAVTGNGRALTSLNASNLDTGTVPSDRLTGSYSISVTSASTAGTVTTAAQPNITSVGTLSSLTVTGNVAGGNLTTGAQVVATGNVSGGNLNTAGRVVATGNVTGGNLTTAGRVDATGNITGGNLSGTLITGTLTTAAQPNVTSVGTLSSLTVVGPTTHTGNIDVTGNINVTGNLNYSNVTDLVIGDPLIFIGANNTGNIVDLGEVVQWNDGTAQYGGLVRDASDGVWKLFGNVTSAPTTTVNFTDALYQSMLVGPLSASSGSFSTTLGVTGNANVGNLGTAGSVVATGNITGGNLNTGARVVATGNVTGGNLTTAGRVDATGNVAGGNLTTAGVVSATGNITGGNLTTAGQVTATGNVSGANLNTAGEVTATGNVTGNNFVGNVSGSFADFTGNVSASYFLGNVIGNISGNLTVGGANTQIVFNDEGSANATAGFTFDKSSNLVTASGNVSASNLVSSGLVVAIGNVAGGNITTAGVVDATGNVSGGNITTAGRVDATGNVSGGNITTAGLVSAGTTVTATGNVTGGNIITAGQVTATGNVSGGNLTTAGQVVATGNVTGGNLVTAATVAGATALVSGQLTAGSASAYDSQGEIIAYGTGRNMLILQTSDNAQDRGLAFRNGAGAYAGAIWLENSTQGVNLGNLVLGVSSGTHTLVTSVEDRMVLSPDGNVHMLGNLLVDDAAVVTGNVSGGNITTAGLVSATGNVTGGNITTAGRVVATGNVTGGNLTTAGLISAGTTVTATGNVTGGNLVTAGVVSATGNVTGGNLNTGAQVVATGNITGGNIITAGTVIATGNVQTAANVVYANAAGSPQAYQFYNSAASSIDTVFI